WHQRRAAEYESQLAAEFTRTFPGWSTPANVRTVIDSEYRKIAGHSPTASPAATAASGLRMLDTVLSKLPPDVKFTLDHMTFAEASFELQGRLKSYEDADKLASAARAAGLNVPPPQAN